MVKVDMYCWGGGGGVHITRNWLNFVSLGWLAWGEWEHLRTYVVVVWMSKAFTYNFDKSECGDSGGGGGDECFDGGGERCGGADGGWK